MVYAPDGRTLARAGEDKLIRFQDVASGRTLATLAGHEDVVDALAFTRRPDPGLGRLRQPRRALRTWSAGKERATLKGHRNIVFTVAFAPDGETLASGGYDRLVKTLGRPPERRGRHPRRPQRLSALGRLRPRRRDPGLGGGNRTVELWDVTEGRRSGRP